MTDEPKQYDPKDDDRARDAAERPLETAAKPETGDEKMIRNRFTAPVTIAIIVVVVVIAYFLLFW